MNVSYDFSFFFALFFVFVPVTLVLLTRRVRGWRKVLWAFLALLFSWLACAALVMLVPPSPESEDRRTPWQQRTWVVAVLAMLTVSGPLSGLWPREPLKAPPIHAGRSAESAYDVIENQNYVSRIHDALEDKHGAWLGWHRFFTLLLVIQKDRFMTGTPYVRVVFPDNSKIQYNITQISTDRFEMAFDSAADAAGNRIYDRQDAEQYRWSRGRLIDDSHVARFVAYLSGLAINVTNEAVAGEPARWECPGPQDTMSCRIFSDRAPRQSALTTP
ncbi:MAG: hypothetical protein AAF358_18195 [Pseudomonadota bacterium]